MSQRKRGGPRRGERLPERFVDWCRRPEAVAVGILGSALAIVLSVTVDFGSIWTSLFPPRPQVIDFHRNPETPRPPPERKAAIASPPRVTEHTGRLPPPSASAPLSEDKSAARGVSVSTPVGITALYMPGEKIPREILEEGSQWTIRIENPLDASVIVTRATIRAVPNTSPPSDYSGTPAAQLLKPTASYRVPISCDRPSQIVPLNPPVKLDPKDIAEVIFKAPLGRYPCRLFVSFQTSGGRTPEVEATGS